MEKDSPGSDDSAESNSTRVCIETKQPSYINLLIWYKTSKFKGKMALSTKQPSYINLLIWCKTSKFKKKLALCPKQSSCSSNDLVWYKSSKFKKKTNNIVFTGEELQPLLIILNNYKICNMITDNVERYIFNDDQSDHYKSEYNLENMLKENKDDSVIYKKFKNSHTDFNSMVYSMLHSCKSMQHKFCNMITENVERYIFNDDQCDHHESKYNLANMLKENKDDSVIYKKFKNSRTDFNSMVYSILDSCKSTQHKFCNMITENVERYIFNDQSDQRESNCNVFKENIDDYIYTNSNIEFCSGLYSSLLESKKYNIFENQKLYFHEKEKHNVDVN